MEKITKKMANIAKKASYMEQQYRNMIGRNNND